ncbi:EAL and GGDEF domain-containing protein [Thiohalorhabdus sp. Cl-TMA]|uniref:EAL domain-containing protein n=1 Tax=Thiohalorhabdus methylotrophus TaxID=3242694 RepID=A0ABV4TW18_9GAMM
MEEQRARLRDMVRSSAALIEAVTAFDRRTQARLPEGQPGGAGRATLSQIRRGLARLDGFGKRGEILVGERSGERLEIPLRSPEASGAAISVPRSAGRAEALSRALRGGTGVMVGRDYRGARVLAAYAPLPGLDMGLVANLPLREIRAPFWSSGLLSGAIGLVVGLAGAGLYLAQITPVWRRLRFREREQRNLLANIPGTVFRCRNDPDWTMEPLSFGAEASTSAYPEALRFRRHYPYARLIHEEDREAVWGRVQAAVAEGAPYEVRYRLRDPEDGIRWIWERGRPVPDPDSGGTFLEGFFTDVTEAEETARSRDRLAQIVESTPDFVGIADAERRLIYLNRAARELVSGSPDGEVRARYLEELHPQWAWAFLSGVAMPQSASGRPWEGELAVLTASGEEVPVVGVVQCHADHRGQPAHYSCHFRDVTEEKVVHRSLRQERDFNRAMTDSLPGLFYVIDEDLQLVRWNQNMERVTGASGKELQERGPLAFIREEDRSAIRQRMREVFEAGENTAEAWVLSRSKPPIPYHFQSRRVTLNQRPYLIGFGTDLTERKAHEVEVARLSYRDPLTGLANRALLVERLGEEVERAKRHQLVGGLLFLDLDDFKPVNDSMGHSVGDEVLKALTGRLIRELRAEDTMARFGGDEFVILLPHLGDSLEAAGHAAQQVAERLQEAMEAPVAVADTSLHLNVSQGISLFPVEAGERADEVLRRADSAMYEAKQAGKGQIRFFRPEALAAIQERLSLGQELRLGILNGELDLHFQPLVELGDGRVSGAEVLVRWNHPERGSVGPDVFIPLAEQNGFIVPLGGWILQQALQRAEAWRRRGMLPRDWHLAVNVSPRQFAHPGFVEQVEGALESSGLPGWMVILEITETVLLEDPSVPNKMAALNRRGIQFAVDDFGTGYSSLINLKQLPVKTLKIDKSFVQDLAWNTQSRTITETILLMASSLNLSTVAEGIETRDQAERVKAWGCGSGQGYLFGRPMAEEDFHAYLRSGAPVLPGLWD